MILPSTWGDDNFATWEEVFRETYKKTQMIFESASQNGGFPHRVFDVIGQTSQHPMYFGELPQRIEREE